MEFNMKKEIIIKDIVGSTDWVQVADGLKVYEIIVSFLKDKEIESINLSFSGRKFVITAFLNAAIGKLYNGQFTADELDRLSFVDIEKSDKEKIERVIQNAKLYYANPRNREFRDELFKKEAEE